MAVPTERNCYRYIHAYAKILYIIIIVPESEPESEGDGVCTGCNNSYRDDN